MKRAMDETEMIQAARQARSDFLRAALARFWSKLSGRSATPVAAEAA
jgi:hypothetical protein